MLKRLLFLFVVLFAVANAQQKNNSQQTLNQINQTFFIPNQGQWNPEVKYLTRIGGMNAWITSSGVVYDYYHIKKNFYETQTSKLNQTEKVSYKNKNTTIEGDVVRMQLVKPENNITGIGNNQREGYYNYFIGNDKNKWASNIPLYGDIVLKGVYKNIDIKYYYDRGQLRYDYIAQPGANISQIKFKFEGQQGIRVNNNGELVLKTSLGEVTNGKIYAYQTEGGSKQEVACKFEQRRDGTIGLKTNSYDIKKELIIDPLVYSTFIGGTGDDEAESITVDSIGNTYITGITSSTNYPLTTGAYQVSYNGGSYDIFVTKLNSKGNGLVFSTFIGGNNGDYALSVKLSNNLDIYLTGVTSSSNYPTTIGAYQTNYGGGNYDAFVTKLNSSGSALAFSTYIGGSDFDQANSLAIDSQDNTYITGATSSSNFPTSSDVYQKTLKGSQNVFVAKLNSNGTALVYSTLIGGNEKDGAASIALDIDGNAYISGNTSSTNYPVSTNAYQKSLNGQQNPFITKLNPAGSGLVYSTYIGGNNIDNGAALAIDSHKDAYLVGSSTSANFPITGGAYQTTLKGYQNVFVSKLDSSGSNLIYSTFIGGSGNDMGIFITVDSSGDACFTGGCNSSDYPTTNDAFQNNYGGGNSDAFVSELNSTGSNLLYSTFLGGSNDEKGYSISLNDSGKVYITGNTSSPNYPTTIGAYQNVYAGGTDAFLTKLSLITAPNTVSLVSPPNNSSGNVQPLKLKWMSASNTSSYRLQISTDSTFAAATVDTVGLTDTTFTISGLSNFIKYYWHVNAENAGGAGSWSPIWNYTTTSPDSLLLSPSILSFGAVPLADSVSQIITLKNLSVLPLSISALSTTSKLFSVQTSTPLYILGKDSTTLTVWFKPSGLGSYNDTLSIVSDRGTEKVRLNGLCPSPILLTGVSSLSFGDVATNDTSSFIIRVTDGSVNKLVIDSAYTKTAEFKINFPSESNVSRGDTLKMDIKFTAANPGIYSDTLFIVNNTEASLVKIPLSANVPWSLISTFPQTLSFGSVPLDSTKETILSIKDVSISILRVDSLWTGTKYFSVSHFLAINILKDSDTLKTTVMFTPDSSYYYGDTLFIANNSKISPYKILLTGEGANTTGLSKISGNVPKVYALFQNYPNPFNPSSNIRYALPFKSNVKIEVYNILGEKIKELVNEQKNTGYYEVNFSTNGLASGVYFYTIEAKSVDGKGSFRDTKKMLLLK